MSRIIQASTRPGAWVFDPFTGSSTTGIAANLFGRRFLGIDNSVDFLQISKARRMEIDDLTSRKVFLEKLQKQSPVFVEREFDFLQDECVSYGVDLPF